MSNIPKNKSVNSISQTIAISNSLPNNWNIEDLKNNSLWFKSTLEDKNEEYPTIKNSDNKSSAEMKNKLNQINTSANKIKDRTIEQIKLAAKCVNLSLNRNVSIVNPRYISIEEYENKIKNENEAVQSMMNLFNKVGCCSMYEEGANIALSVFQDVGETFYKMFRGREGHMKGEEKSVYIALSSFALYVIVSHPIFKEELKEKILYEDIQYIILGANERWISFVKRPSTTSTNAVSRKAETNWVQIEIGDSDTTMDLVKFLESAIRRKAVFLRLNSENVNSLEENTNLNLQFAKGKYEDDSRSQARKILLSRQRCFSIGQYLEPFIPSVISFSSQETEFMESWLTNLQKFERKPKVLACWLVFWENGSISAEEAEAQLEPSPSIEGFLMVNKNYQLTSWMPAYFILKCGMLYQFHDFDDPLPHCLIELNECCGCLRLPSNTRPHAFQLLRENDPPLQLAAPNEEIASQWLQTFLQILSMKGEEQKRRKLQPCQLIQTTAGLALSFQSNIFSFFKPLTSKSAAADAQNKKSTNVEFEFPASSKCSSVNKTTNLNLHINYTGLVTNDKTNKLSRNNCRLSTVESNQQESPFSPIYKKKEKNFTAGISTASLAVGREISAPFVENAACEIRCPPTPPLPKGFPENETNPKKCQQEIPLPSEQCLQLLSFCNLNQISEVFVTAFKSNACLLDFECSEACEIVGDWALYFFSEDHLQSFLSTVVESRQILGEDRLPITAVTSGLSYQLLREGSALSKSMWLKKC